MQQTVMLWYVMLWYVMSMTVFLLEWCHRLWPLVFDAMACSVIVHDVNDCDAIDSDAIKHPQNLVSQVLDM